MRFSVSNRVHRATLCVLLASAGAACSSKEAAPAAAGQPDAGAVHADGERVTFDPTQPQELVTAEGVGVKLPAGALVTADGSDPPQGEVTATLGRRLSPDSSPAEMPGGFDARSAGGDPVTLISYGVVEIAFEDAASRRLDLRDGERATITIPALAEGPASMPLWYLDEGRGYWVEEGTVAWSDGAYVGDVTHFSFWNADLACDQACARGRLVDGDGNPASGVEVMATLEETTCPGFRRGALGGGQAASGSDGTFRLETLVPASRYELAAGGETQALDVPATGRDCVDVGDVVVRTGVGEPPVPDADAGAPDASAELRDAGSQDAGPDGAAAPDAGLACARPVSGAPTGSATAEGATWTTVSPVDAVAVIGERTYEVYDEGLDDYVTRQVRELRIRLVQHANACGHERANVEIADSPFVSLRIFTESPSGLPAVPGTGTHPLPPLYENPTPDVTYATVGIEQTEAACITSGGDMSQESSGSVTIDSITADRVTGSYTFTDPVLGNALSGTFSAPICSPDPGSGERCCMGADPAPAPDAAAPDAGDVDGGSTPAPACELASPAPTGSATLTGANFTAVDAVAIVTRREDVATEWQTHPYRTELEVRLTDYASACARELGGVDVQDARWMRLLFVTASETEFPTGLPGVGTYLLSSEGAMAWDTPYFRGAGLRDHCGEQCGLCAYRITGTPTGSVTVTDVSDTQIEGSFEYSVPDMSIELSGTFVAPICTGPEAAAERCCAPLGSGD